jgi:aspartyl protease family protein
VLDLLHLQVQMFMNNDFSSSAKLITFWLVLATVLFLGVQWWQHHKEQTRWVQQGETIEIRRSTDGHYHWPGTINGVAVDFLIDTGATQTAISQELSQQLELKSHGTVRSYTAGGEVSGQWVKATITLQGGWHIEQLSMVALPGLNSFQGRPLLGMNVLKNMTWTQQSGVLHIERSVTP